MINLIRSIIFDKNIFGIQYVVLEQKKFVLWHGTEMINAKSIISTGPSLINSRKSLDFGAGFYLTTRHYQACLWAEKKAHNKSTPAVLGWSICYDDFEKWNKICFSDAGPSADDFWEFVRLNRRRKKPHRSAPQDFFDVVGPASKWYQSRTPVYDLDQVSFHTNRGLNFLKSNAIVSSPQYPVI